MPDIIAGDMVNTNNLIFDLQDNVADPNVTAIQRTSRGDIRLCRVNDLSHFVCSMLPNRDDFAWGSLLRELIVATIKNTDLIVRFAADNPALIPGGLGAALDATVQQRAPETAIQETILPIFNIASSLRVEPRATPTARQKQVL